ncbi:uncharacterized protein LOC135105999 isoform X2 [Scylla paramamosain]|uniref:uncharacterized protein LOC135105999 isoform X2 n=1 Tax=Scylla paramamosain TaxID=85552 RepID=UPI0030838A17
MGTYSYIHSEGRKPDQSPPHPTVHGISSPRPIVVLCPARLPSDKGVHPLHLAASRGDVYEVAELLRKGANPHASNQRGFRALHFAAEGGFVEVVKLLTHYGACVGAPTNDGLLAVHLAAKNGHVQILEQLQKLHCDLTSRDHSQATPLHYAAQHGKLKAVEWMIKTKVPLDSKDNEGKTAADRAKEKRYLEVVKVLDVAISKQTKKPPFTIPRPTPISAVFGSDVTPPPQQAPSPVNYRRSVTSQHASSTSQQHILSPTLISQTRTPPIIYSILKDTESTRIPSPEQIESTPVPSPEQTDSIPIPSPPPLFPSYIPPLTDSTVPTLYTEEKKKQKKENKKKRMGALLKSSLVYCTCYKRNEILETELRETHTDNGMITDSRIIGIGSEKHPITELPLDGFPRESSIMELQVRPAVQPCPNGPSVYPCHSNPRGRVLILNNKSFTGDQYPCRSGSECDTVNLERVYHQMGYEVVTRYDLSRAATLEFFSKESQNSKLSHVSSLFVFVMSHGDGPRTFITHDTDTVTIDEVMNFFLSNNCHFLSGKPKIFFSHFCRGEDEEIRPTLFPEAKREAYRDMLCIFSSTSGFQAYRHPTLGTPSVRAFCKALADHAHCKMLFELIREFQTLFEKMEGASSPEVQNLSFSKDLFLNPIGTRL